MVASLGEGWELVAVEERTYLSGCILSYRNYQVDLRIDLISTK